MNVSRMCILNGYELNYIFVFLFLRMRRIETPMFMLAHIGLLEGFTISCPFVQSRIPPAVSLPGSISLCEQSD